MKRQGRILVALLFCPTILLAQVTVNDPRFGEQWYLKMAGTEQQRADVRAYEAWSITTGSPNTKIAIIEGGDGEPDYYHEDLLTRVTTHNTLISSEHATMVAGLIVANPNSVGIVGVDWFAHLNSYSWDNSSLWGARLDQAVSDGNQIISASQNIDNDDATITAAMARAYNNNRTTVTSMGNGQGTYPANSSLIAVGASTKSNARGTYSNTGSFITLLAPGGTGTGVPADQNILSTSTSSPGYNTNWGTSFAAPLVAGAAGLLLAKRPDLYNDDIKNLLILSCDKLQEMGQNYFTSTCGYGRLNVKKALDLLQSPSLLRNDLSAIGGTDVGSSDLYQMAIVGVSGIGSGTYYVIRHEIRKDVSFNGFSGNVNVWGRGAASNGWSQTNPMYGKQFCEVVPGTVTANSATLRTYIYEVMGKGTYPTTADKVVFAYSVLGTAQQLSVDLSAGQSYESGSGGTYQLNGQNWTGGTAFYGDKISAVPPNGSWIFTGWSDGVLANPRTLTGNLTAHAIYKVLHLSTNAAAFGDNSQHKFLRTTNGWLHMVYESAGRVWLEHSSNNGTTWMLNNPDGASVVPGPIDVGAGKCPSMAAVGNTVLVVFQQQDGSNYKLILQSFIPSQDGSHYFTQMNSGLLYPVYSGETSDPYTTDANPTIAWSSYGKYALVTFERKGAHPGLHYVYTALLADGTPAPQGPQLSVSDTATVPTTNANSIYASLSTNGTPNSSGVVSFDLAWQQYSTSTRSDIWYAMVLYDPNHTPVIYPNSDPGMRKNISSASYYACSVRPSVASLADQTPRVCWVGDKDGLGTYYNMQAVMTKPLGPAGYTALGAAVKSVSATQLDNGADFYYAYSQNYPTNSWLNAACKGSNPQSIVTLSTAGKDIQLSNGPSSASLYLSSYYPFTAPYSIQTSQSLGSAGLSKSDPTQLLFGRGVALSRGQFKYSYYLGNLIVDGKSVDFVPVPDSLRSGEMANLNAVLETQPFSVSGSSKITFSESSGFLDSTIAAQTLGSSGFVGCTVELVDAATRKSLGTIRNSASVPFATSAGALIPYSLGVDGILSTLAKMRVTLHTSLVDCTATLVSSYSTVNPTGGLAKSSEEQLMLTQIGNPTAFCLEGNYPNPFNPSTTIQYALPTTSQVTLVIYDVLGRVVTTLEKGVVDAGYHSATWNAMHVASGVYLARLVVSDFTGRAVYIKTTKLLLTK